MRHHKASLRHFDKPITRMRRYEHSQDHFEKIVPCSRCKVLPAYWLLRGGCLQRYYCNECVKVTEAWKERQAAEADSPAEEA